MCMCMYECVSVPMYVCNHWNWKVFRWTQTMALCLIISALRGFRKLYPLSPYLRARKCMKWCMAWAWILSCWARAARDLAPPVSSACAVQLDSWLHSLGCGLFSNNGCWWQLANASVACAYNASGIALNKHGSPVPLPRSFWSSFPFPGLTRELCAEERGSSLESEAFAT